jgi:alkanesulfonate monooxygenase SsuD/methylene tetrahydromethanopterin reductase-like flavin-dependent oxidoreductase (luciferase family)
MGVRYALSFANRAMAEAAAAKLADSALRVSVGFQVYVDATAASAEEVDAMHIRLRLIADEFDGHFLGTDPSPKFDSSSVVIPESSCIPTPDLWGAIGTAGERAV